MVTRSASKLLRIGAAAMMLSACASGESGHDTPAPAPVPTVVTETSENTGSVSLSLRAAPNVAISIVSYRIVRGAYDRPGTIEVSNSSTISALIGNIPAATGYALSLTAADSTQQLLTCAGATSFDVVAKQTTPVTVGVQCHETVMQPPPPPVPIPWGTIPVLSWLLYATGAGALRRRSRRAESASE